MNKDAAFGTVTLAVAVVYYRMAGAIPSSFLADGVGPQGLPKVYAWVLGALSIVLVARSVRLRDQAGAGTVGARFPAVEPLKVWRVAGLLAIGAAYVAIVPWLGYMLSVAALIFTTIYYQGGGITRRGVAVALSGAIALWLLFVVLLRIPQPAGLWPAFY